LENVQVPPLPPYEQLTLTWDVSLQVAVAEQVRGMLGCWPGRSKLSWGWGQAPPFGPLKIAAKATALRGASLGAGSRPNPAATDVKEKMALTIQAFFIASSSRSDNLLLETTSWRALGQSLRIG
jgi:hypothetical protein